MDEALRLCERAAQHPPGACSAWSSRRRSTPAPPTCSATVSRRRRRAACRSRSTPRKVVVEFHEITRRHGITPIELARQSRRAVGALDHRARHLPRPPSRDTPGRQRDDLATLAETGTTVAHCPTVFAAPRHHAEEFRPLPRAAACNIGIGTDTYPHNMLEEMRAALIPRAHRGGNVARPAHHRPVRRRDDRRRAGAAAATTSAGSPPAAKADIVLVDITPSDDAAGARSRAQPDLRRGRPGGAGRSSSMARQVVEDGRVTDHGLSRGAAAALRRRRSGSRANVASLDWANATSRDLAAHFPDGLTIVAGGSGPSREVVEGGGASAPAAQPAPILQVRDLKTVFRTERGPIARRRRRRLRRSGPGARSASSASPAAARA